MVAKWTTEGSDKALRGAALVAANVRGWIVDGRLRAGEALPSHLELASQFGVSTVAVQNGLNLLGGQGFVDARRGVGTFVSARPPHLHQYGLVFWNDPKAPLGHVGWSRYYQALTLAAAEAERSSDKRLLQFHGVDWHTDSPDRVRLIEHLETHRLAGIVFVNIPQHLGGTPILDLPGIPRLAIETESQHPNVRTVNFDSQQWLDKALDHLAAKGRTRVAAIANASSSACAFFDREYDRLQAALAARGMSTCPRWMQFAPMNFARAARQATEILAADRERPDALLVLDDNYVEPALQGLQAAGVSVPDDIAVVGHANFPLPPAKTLPVRLLGYDQRATLRTAIAVIDRWRAGDVPPETTTLPALWEEEVGR